MTLTINFVKILLENLTKYYCNYLVCFKFNLRRVFIIFGNEENYEIVFSVGTV